MAGNKPLIQNPFTNEELEECFVKQRDKIPFEFEKQVNIPGGKPVILRVSCLEATYEGVWDDTHFVSFSYDDRNTTYGFGCPYNLFGKFNDFKDKLFELYNIEEDAQLSLF